jgi:hypothetical protein
MKRLRQSRDVLIAHARRSEHSGYLAGGRPAGQACSKAALFGKVINTPKIPEIGPFVYFFIESYITQSNMLR